MKFQDIGFIFVIIGAISTVAAFPTGDFRFFIGGAILVVLATIGLMMR